MCVFVLVLKPQSMPPGVSQKPKSVGGLWRSESTARRGGESAICRSQLKRVSVLYNGLRKGFIMF